MKIERTPVAYKVRIELGDRKPKPYSFSMIIQLLFIVSVTIFFLFNVLKMVTKILTNPSALNIIYTIIYTTTMYTFIIIVLNITISKVFQDDVPYTSPLRIGDIVKAIEKGKTIVYLHDYQIESVSFEKRSVKEYCMVDDYYVIVFDDFDDYSYA